MTRLRSAADKDASLNALAVLQAGAALVSVSLEDGMRRVRSMYQDDG